MLAETIVSVVFILGFILLHSKLKGSKVYDYITLLILPFLIFYLFFDSWVRDSSACVLILLLTGGFIYQAVKFYNMYLKESF